MDENIRLLTKIATLYYKNGLTQEELAERLGMSRQTIGRCLQRARQRGLVEIEIRSPLIHNTELESQLESSFGLKEAIVVSPNADTEEATQEALGEAGAEFIQRRIQANDTIGVSWSGTVLACVLRLQTTRLSGITVVQMNGSLDRGAFSTRAEFIVDRLAQAFGGRQVTLAAPLLVDRREIKDSLLSDSRTAAALERAAQANFAVFGVGDISPRSSLYKTRYMDHTLLDQLLASGAVGDICGRFFNPQGEICLPEVDERTLAIPLDCLRKKKISVAIAGSPHKAQAIRGMLKGRYCNVLITDEETAIAVLKIF